ncbi:MAG: DUF5640 domain-containing protein [Oscillospiraceae bacterium]|nr:DUF5640 domain-containing protein [Oscillospiraceae bacterium]
MKKAISLVLIFVLVLAAFASCGSPEKKLIGTWKGDVEILGVTTSYEYTFNEDGTGKMTGVLGSTGVAFDYSIGEDGKLNVTTKLLGVESTKTYTYTVEKNTLTLTEGETVITLTKAEG